MNEEIIIDDPSSEIIANIERLVNRFSYDSESKKQAYRSALIANIGLLDKWYEDHPPQSNPPLRYDVAAGKYIWLNRKQFRKQQEHEKKQSRLQNAKIMKRIEKYEALKKQAKKLAVESGCTLESAMRMIGADKLGINEPMEGSRNVEDVSEVRGDP